MEDPLALDTRRRLWRIIQERPGSYLRQIQRASGMAMGALEYHLDRLRKADLLRVVDDGHKRFFPAAIPPVDRDVLIALRQVGPRHILLTLLGGPRAKADVQRRLEMPRSTLERHARRLQETRLLVAEGAPLHYRVLDAPRIERLLVTYRASFVDRLVDAFLDGVEPIRWPVPEDVPKSSS